MTVIRDSDIIIPEFKKEPMDYSEWFDINRFFIPAEIFISEEKIAW